MRFVSRLLLVVMLVFALPAAATAAWWSLKDRPDSWRAADWSASGVLTDPARDEEAAVYLMAARTGGLKGAVSVHTWIVMKNEGGGAYERYDKVGWGTPVRRNGYAADALWYSNTPRIVHAVHGEKAAALVPRFQAAIEDYPYAHSGDYRIWPGPNSNSFIAHLLRAVPEFGGRMPPNAVGRDFAPRPAAFRRSADGRDIHATLGGFVGFAAGWNSGFEIHLGGLVAGIDISRPALKIPAYGRLELLPAGLSRP